MRLRFLEALPQLLLLVERLATGITRHVDFPVDSGELVWLVGGILNPYPCEVCKW